MDLRASDELHVRRIFPHLTAPDFCEQAGLTDLDAYHCPGREVAWSEEAHSALGNINPAAGFIFFLCALDGPDSNNMVCGEAGVLSIIGDITHRRPAKSRGQPPGYLHHDIGWFLRIL